MSKSLGTGIDPLEEIDVHGADALRFGLLAMSSTQDVRYSDAKVQQGRDLANKLWNASRLILLNRRQSVEPAPSAAPAVEDRWILSRLERTIASVTEKLEAYDFAHAAQEAYSFFWSELCDWYLEIVKPRLYDGEEEVSATLLYALERVLALLHPMMPFVTEEIWSYHPAAQRPPRRPPVPGGRRVAVRRRRRGGRRGRDRADPAPARLARPGRGRRRRATLPARVDGVEPPEFVGRLARFEFGEDGGEPVAVVGPVKVLASDEIDAEAVADAAREAPRGAARRGRARRAQARQRGLRRQGAGRGGRGGARQARALPRRARGARANTTREAYLDSLEPIGWKLGLERMHRLTARCSACPSTASPRSTSSAPTASPR